MIQHIVIVVLKLVLSVTGSIVMLEIGWITGVVMNVGLSWGQRILAEVLLILTGMQFGLVKVVLASTRIRLL